MANGIDGITIPPPYPQDEGGITDIAIEAGKDQASIKAKEIIDSFDPTGFLSNQIKAFDLRNLGEALAEGDTESARDIFYNEVSQLQDTAPLAVLSSLGITNNPLGNVIAAGNLANNAIQKFAMGSEIISGMDIPGDNIFSSGIEKGLDFINKPVQAGANIFGTGITQATGDYQNMMNNVLFNTPYYKFMANQVAKPFDLLYNIGLPSFFNKDKKPDPPVQLTNEQINQIVKDEENLNPPPVFTPPPATTNEAEVAYGGQQVDPGGGMGGGSYGGGEDFGSPFKPPSGPPSGPPGGMSYQSFINRANGGLVSISRYLKGR